MPRKRKSGDSPDTPAAAETVTSIKYPAKRRHIPPAGLEAQGRIAESPRLRYEWANRMILGDSLQVMASLHLNYVACDTNSWEQAAMLQLEKLAMESLVHCYARNDPLEFNIPYELYGNAHGHKVSNLTMR